jgi:L-lactate dehydrogenase
VSSLQHGVYAIRNTCMSVPTLLGAKGVIGHLEVDLCPRELQRLKASARVLEATLDRMDF